MSEVINFQRRFKIWSYDIGHGLLLLRSTKDNKYESQIDVLFSNVAFISLPALFDQARIAVMSKDECTRASIPLAVLGMDGRNCYSITGQDWKGYVVAGGCVFVENKADYFDRSILLDKY